MINRWQGNSGRVQRLPEQADKRPSVPAHRMEPAPPKPSAAVKRGPAMPQTVPPLYSAGKKPTGIFKGLEGLKKLIPGKTEEMETEDLILLLILYLMSRESGDSELLMIMGAMFLL